MSIILGMYYVFIWTECSIYLQIPALFQPNPCCQHPGGLSERGCTYTQRMPNAINYKCGRWHKCQQTQDGYRLLSFCSSGPNLTKKSWIIISLTNCNKFQGVISFRMIYLMKESHSSWISVIQTWRRIQYYMFVIKTDTKFTRYHVSVLPKTDIHKIIFIWHIYIDTNIKSYIL